VLEFQRFYGDAKQRVGVGWRFVITCFQQKCKKLQSNCKATAKKTAKPQTPDFQGFDEFLCSYCSDTAMYRKNGHLACKNRANGRAGGGLG
jgi:hypothetical protein